MYIIKKIDVSKNGDKWKKKTEGEKKIMLLDSTGGPKYIVGFSRIQDRSLQGPPVLNTRNITC